MEEFGLTYKKEGTTLIVEPKGRLDTATSPEMERRLKPELAGMKDVIMDFAGVDYIFSGGLRALLNIDQKMEEKGGGLKLIHVNEYIMEIFEMTGFSDLVPAE